MLQVANITDLPDLDSEALASLGFYTNLPLDYSASDGALNKTVLGDGVLERQVSAAPGQQQPVGVALKIISQPPGILTDQIGSYAYDNEINPILVYVVDSGADTTTAVSFPRVDIAVFLIRVGLSRPIEPWQDSIMDMARQRQRAEPTSGVEFQLR